MNVIHGSIGIDLIIHVAASRKSMLWLTMAAACPLITKRHDRWLTGAFSVP